MNNSELSKVIDIMRLPLIFFVIIAHLVPFTLPVVHFPSNANALSTLISETFSHHLAKLSVRCYFLVSGYYFFNRYKDDLLAFLKRHFKSRFRTLLIPYVVWNVLTVIAVFFKNYTFNYLGMPLDDHVSILEKGNLYNIFWGLPANFPLWYIRDLLCMIVLSPLIYFFLKYLKRYGIIILAVLYVGSFDTNVPGLSLTAIFFFSLGAYFSIEKKDILYVFNKIKSPAYLLMICFLVLSLANNGQQYQEYFLRIFILTGVVSIFNLFSYLSERFAVMNLLQGFSSLSFFIYVVHEIYIINWLKGYFYGLTMYENGGGKILIYFAIPFLCLAICAGLYYLLLKIAPKLLVFSLGGRMPNYNNRENDREKRIESHH